MSETFRFAPSPTGYLHIGGARTALFNWLLARKTGGRFVLRIEDTDKARGSEEMVQGIIDGLSWLGLDYDGELVFQGQNAEHHRQVAEQLLATGHAYRCFCSRETIAAKRKACEEAKQDWLYDKTCLELSEEEIQAKLDAGEEYVLRFNVDRSRSVSWTDLVYGEQCIQCSTIEDFVILRSDGSPLYNLGVSCDDHSMGVTTVLRGQDHLSNTPKQILLYEAMGWSVPKFGHLPLIMAPGRKKLSKRVHGEVVSLGTYQQRGFVPDAMRNYLALLGWNPGGDREFLSTEELIELFDPARINRSNAVFNFSESNPLEWTDKKALHLNSMYINEMEEEQLWKLVLPYLLKAGLFTPVWAEANKPYIMRVLLAHRTRMFTLTDFAERLRAYFVDEYPIETKPLQKNLLKKPELRTLLPELAGVLAELPAWEAASIEPCLREFAEAREVKDGLLINGCRTVLSGQAAGPGAFELIELIGRERTIGRLRAVENLYLAAEGE